MKNKNVKNSKLIGLRKSTVAKLITNGHQINGGAVQQFALLEAVDEDGELITFGASCIGDC